jgi:Arc/MetJ-type ribon-helix-helix transcriptional regulator
MSMSTKERLSASVDADLIAAAQDAVASGTAESVSAWVNDALRLKADHEKRLAALDEFLSAFEAEHGEITEREMRETVREARASAVVVRGRRVQPTRGGED